MLKNIIALVPSLQALKSPALWISALLIAGSLLAGGIWAYRSGSERCEDRHRIAAAAIAEKLSQANAREAAAVNRAAQAEALLDGQLTQRIEERHAPDDDDPAPAVMQLVFDGLRQ